MKIDIQTLSLIMIISFVLQSIALYFLYHQSKRYKGLLHWTTGSAMISAGLILMITRQIPGFEYFSIITSNLLHAGGLFVILVGTAFFTNSKIYLKPIYLYLISYLLFLVYFTILDDQINIRAVGYSVSVAGISLLTAIKLWKFKRGVFQEPATLAAIVFYIISGLFTVRIYSILFFSPMTDPFLTTNMQTAVFFTTFVLGIVWTFGLIMMVNQKFYCEKLEAKKHFELIFNSNPDISLILKLPEEIVAEVNDAYIKATGYKRDEIIGISAKTDVNPFVNLSERNNMIQLLTKSGYCSNIEITFQRKDRSVLHGLFSARMIEIEGIPHLICIIKDITEQKDAEKKIILSEKKYRELFENAPIGIFTSTLEGKTLNANPYLTHLLGFDNSSEAIRHYSDLANQLYHNQKKRDEFIKLLTKKKNVVNFEFEVLTADKRKIWFSMNARKTTNENEETIIEGFITDVTMRKRNEYELREKEFQYRNLANAGVALIWTAATDKLCTFVNEPWLQFTGRTVDMELGTGWTENVHHEDLDRYMDTYVSHFNKREPFQIQYRLRHHSGEYRWINDRGTPNYNSEGKFLGYIGHCFDINDQKNLEFELIAAKEKAEESDRLKSSFLANLSHEIRTPMNSIMGFASLLPNEDDSEIMTRYSKIIVRSSEQLLRIIDDIVFYSQLQTKLFSFYPSQFNVDELLIEVQQAFNIPEYKKGVDLKVQLMDGSTTFLFSDFEKLKQILSNLVSNAFKYTLSGSITLGYMVNQNDITLSVGDTGIGIPADESEKIFDRFYRGTNINRAKIGGTGLGLSIVKELIDLIRGTIWVESEINKGSIFFITLPLKQEEHIL